MLLDINGQIRMVAIPNSVIQVGDMLLNEVEVNMSHSSIPHGHMDLMVVSCLLKTPLVCYFKLAKFQI